MLPTGKRANLDVLARVIGEFDLVGLAGSRRRQPALGLSQPDAIPRRSRRVSVLEPPAEPARVAPRDVEQRPARAHAARRSARLSAARPHSRTRRAVGAFRRRRRRARRRHRASLARTRRAHAPARFHRRADRPASERRADGRSQHAARRAPSSRCSIERTALEPPHESPATFPSWRPTRAIDHILVSGSIEVERRWALSHPVSDHLPVAATIRLPLRACRSAADADRLFVRRARAAMTRRASHAVTGSRRVCRIARTAA